MFALFECYTPARTSNRSPRLAWSQDEGSNHAFWTSHLVAQHFRIVEALPRVPPHNSSGTRSSTSHPRAARHHVHRKGHRIDRTRIDSTDLASGRTSGHQTIPSSAAESGEADEDGARPERFPLPVFGRSKRSRSNRHCAQVGDVEQFGGSPFRPFAPSVVSLSGNHTRVAEQLLNGRDVRSGVEQ